MQVMSLFVANLGVILWFRVESRNDWRHLDSKLETYMAGMREDTKAFQEAIRQDIKDFHGRLCAIEERNKNDKKNKE